VHRLPQELARRGDGHAERRFGTAVLPILNAKSIGLTITLEDMTEEEFRVLELIEDKRQEGLSSGDGGNRSSR
jgi:hypothetical protein